MPSLRRPPDHTISATGHAFQRQLALLDPTLELWFNTKLHRYELWRYELTPFGKTYGFLRRVEQDGRFAEPGEWFLALMRERDPRYRPAKEVAALYISEFNADEKARRDRNERELDDKLEQISHEYAPVFMRKIKDDNLFGRFFRGFRRSRA